MRGVCVCVAIMANGACGFSHGPSNDVIDAADTADAPVVDGSSDGPPPDTALVDANRDAPPPDSPPPDSSPPDAGSERRPRGAPSIA